MSVTTMLVWASEGNWIDGTPGIKAPFRYPNAWGSAYRVWDSVWKFYGPPGRSDMLPMGGDSVFVRDFWKLGTDPRLPEFAQAAMRFTFDRVVIPRESMARLADDLDTFSRHFPAGEGNVDHLPSIARDLRTQANESGIIAAGFHQTSVSDCPWFEWREDECIDYDLKTGDNHFEIYDS